MKKKFIYSFFISIFIAIIFCLDIIKKSNNEIDEWDNGASLFSLVQ